MNRTISTALLAALVGIAHGEQFQLTITNFGPQPLSPLFYAASTGGFDEFALGGTASAGIKNIAETGNAAAMLGIAAATSEIGTYGLLGASPLAPGGSRTLLFTADSAHPFFSFASMLGKTNDGFIGESVSSAGLRLFNGATARSFSYDVFGDEAWDAGTEKNTQNLIDLNTLGGTMNPAEDAGQNVIRQHAGIVAGLGDSWQLLPSWTLADHLATIQVQAVPEPAPVAFLGLAAVATLRRRRRAH